MIKNVLILPQELNGIQILNTISPKTQTIIKKNIFQPFEYWASPVFWYPLCLKRQIY